MVSGERSRRAGRLALVHSSNWFRMDGFMALLVGQDVPYNKRYEPTPDEREFWRKYRNEVVAEAKRGMTSEEVLKSCTRWGWRGVEAGADSLVPMIPTPGMDSLGVRRSALLFLCHVDLPYAGVDSSHGRRVRSPPESGHSQLLWEPALAGGGGADSFFAKLNVHQPNEDT